MDASEMKVQSLETEWMRICDEHKNNSGRVPKLNSPMVDIIGRDEATIDGFSRHIIGAGIHQSEYAKRLADKAREIDERSNVPIVELPEGKAPWGSERGPSQDAQVPDQTDMIEVLRKMNLKNINLSKSNNNICLSSIGKGYMDVSFIGIDKVSHKGFKVRLCDRAKSDEDLERHEAVMAVDRFSKSMKRDKGQQKLYLAMFMAEGKKRDYPFLVRAPPIYLPVRLLREGTVDYLAYDDSRDPIFNDDFILNDILKTSSSKILKPMTVLEVMEQMEMEGWGAPLMQKIITWYYAQYDIEMEFEGIEAIPFEKLTSKELDEAEEKPFIVKPYMVLGTFENSNSNIMRDINTIVESRDVPVIVGELIKNYSFEETGNTDFYGESKDIIESKDISEKRVMYVNPLNASQEMLIEALDHTDAIVAQGPPGTGKSQTVASIIAQYILQGKRVLVVSEKKTPLDVIQNRLMGFGHMIMNITDSKDKEEFYKQMDQLLSYKGRCSVVDVGPICDAIDADVAKLSKIRDYFHRPMPDFGVDPVDLYALGRCYDLTFESDFYRYNELIDVCSDYVMALDYGILSSVHGDMALPGTAKIMFDYHSLSETYPWLFMIKDNLSEVIINNMVREAREFEVTGGASKKKGLFSKVKESSKGFLDQRKFAEKYLVSGADPSAIINSADLDEMAAIYLQFNEVKEAFNIRDQNLREYSKVVYDAAKGQRSKLKESNDDLYCAVIHKHLVDFGMKHEDAIGVIKGFDSIIESIEARTREKMEATKINVQAAMVKATDNIRPCINDIRRELERFDKLSISKFIRKYSILDSCPVWLMTPESVSDILPMVKGLFDVVIFDEASQMYAERGIPSIFRAKQVVVAGDHKQLRPSSLGASRIKYEQDLDDIDDDVDFALEQESLLDLARFRYPSVMLNFHYRSKYEELIAFSNSRFYKNKLFVSPNVTKPLSPPIEYVKVDGVWNNQSNKAEAKVIVSRVKEILKSHENNESIAVLTFNSRQSELVSEMFESEARKDPEFERLYRAELSRVEDGVNKSLWVGSIESVQGEERDIVFFSTGYARDADGNFYQRFGWLNQKGGENRLNVAITRARMKIVLVSSLEPYELEVDRTKNEGPKILKEYLYYAKAVSDGDEEAVKNILAKVSMDCGEQPKRISEKAVGELCDYLKSKGYSVKRNVGISGHNLDIAVYDSKGYIMGIEADAEIYDLLDSTRARDVHHLRYLRDRGWHVERFFMSSYWRDSKAEFQRIEDIIQEVIVSDA